MRQLPLLLAFALGCGAEAPCGLRTCDVREPACQQMAAAAAACLRGVPAIEVPVAFTDWQAQAAREVAAAEANPDAARWAEANDGLALLGLARAGTTLADTVRAPGAGLGGFFDPTSNSITLISDRDEAPDSPEMVTTLVHEYVHALQGHAGRLKLARATPPERTVDLRLARVAIIEGEARLVEYRATLGLFHRQPEDVAWEQLFARVREDAEREVSMVPAPVHRAPYRFQYPFGAWYVHNAVARGGLAAIDELWGSLPVSARQVMAGFGAPEPAGGPWLEELGAQAQPDLDPERRLIDGDSLGAFVLRLFLRRLNAAQVVEVADHLRGDRLSIFREVNSDRRLVFWRLRFDQESAAETAAAAIPATGPAGSPLWSVRRLGRDLVIIASNVDAGRELLEQATWQPATVEPEAPPLSKLVELMR